MRRSAIAALLGGDAALTPVTVATPALPLVAGIVITRRWASVIAILPTYHASTTLTA